MHQFVSKKDTLFTLNIDINQIDKEYSLNSISDIKKDKLNDKLDITPIENIGITTTRIKPLQTTFQKEKIKIQKYLSLVFNNLNENILEKETHIKCFNCHRYYKTSPLIVPINYEDYNGHCVFKGDTIVCSFNCMLSYIEDNIHNKLYTNSITYMLKLYYFLFGKYPESKIIKAPPFCCLQEYEGPLSETEYDNLLQRVEISDSKQIYMIPISRILNVKKNI